MRRGCGEQLLSLDLPRELPAGPLFVEQLSTGMVESANNPVTHVRRIGEATRRFLWITSFLRFNWFHLVFVWKYVGQKEKIVWIVIL